MNSHWYLRFHSNPFRVHSSFLSISVSSLTVRNLDPTILNILSVCSIYLYVPVSLNMPSHLTLTLTCLGYETTCWADLKGPAHPVWILTPDTSTFLPTPRRGMASSHHSALTSHLGPLPFLMPSWLCLGSDTPSRGVPMRGWAPHPALGLCAAAPPPPPHCVCHPSRGPLCLALPMSLAWNYLGGEREEVGQTLWLFTSLLLTF